MRLNQTSRPILLFLCVFVLGMQSEAAPMDHLTEKVIMATLDGKTFPNFFYPRTEHLPTRGTILKIHGGGCMFMRAMGDRTDSSIDLLDNKLHREGYNVITVDYSVNLELTGTTREEQCANSVREAILRINEIVAELQRSQFKLGPIYLLGHSFGAYLVNYLASNHSKIPGIAGYISLNGIWDSQEIFDAFGKILLVSPIFNPSHNSSNDLSPILIFGTADDKNITPNDQIDRFEKWALTATAPHVMVRFESGGHGYSDKSFRQNITPFISALNDFTTLNNAVESQRNSVKELSLSVFKPKQENFKPVPGHCSVRFQRYGDDLVAYIDHTLENGTITCIGVNDWAISSDGGVETTTRHFLSTQAETRIQDLTTQGWCTQFSSSVHDRQ